VVGYCVWDESGVAGGGEDVLFVGAWVEESEI
jgi:hypothetical protein